MCYNIYLSWIDTFVGTNIKILTNDKDLQPLVLSRQVTSDKSNNHGNNIKSKNRNRKKK